MYFFIGVFLAYFSFSHPMKWSAIKDLSQYRLYASLGIKSTASQEKIEERYKALRFPTAEQIVAYTILHDPDIRAVYDLGGVYSKEILNTYMPSRPPYFLSHSYPEAPTFCHPLPPDEHSTPCGTLSPLGYSLQERCAVQAAQNTCSSLLRAEQRMWLLLSELSKHLERHSYGPAAASLLEHVGQNDNKQWNQDPLKKICNVLFQKFVRTRLRTVQHLLASEHTPQEAQKEWGKLASFSFSTCFSLLDLTHQKWYRKKIKRIYICAPCIQSTTDKTFLHTFYENPFYLPELSHFAICAILMDIRDMKPCPRLKLAAPSHVLCKRQDSSDIPKKD